MNSAAGSLDALFQPVQIGSMTVKNRIVLPPMATNLATKDGFVTQGTIDYYEARARGGAGLVIVEVACVDFPIGKTVAFQIGIDNDKYIEGLSRLAAAIKKHGARAAIQIHHAGREAKARFTGLQPVAPSALPSYKGADLPRELTVAEIAQIVQRYAAGAERAEKAGFDAVEIHGASGYLVAEFLSRNANHRTDAYGGDIEGRAHFLVEIICAIRGKVGAHYPMWVRLNAKELSIEDGTTPEEARLTAQMAEKAGVDAIHISCWGGGTDSDAPFKPVPGLLLPYAQAMRHAVKVPVIAVGSISPALGAATLREGKADLIAIGRALISDADVGVKAQAGKSDDIVPCIACLRCVEEVVFRDKVMKCSVNPAIGHEPEFEIKPAAKKKRVLVIGGGPAGMEAARVAALRGHEVTLCEKDTELGGQLVTAIVPPGKDRIKVLLDYFRRQMGKVGVKVNTGQPMTADVIDMVKPDAVVLASGIESTVPEIPGLDKAKVVMAEDVLKGKAKVGNRVVIIGGELVGCETADLLSDQGKKVTVTRRGARMAAGMMPILRLQLVTRLGGKGVTLLTGVKYERFTDEGLVITDNRGQQQTIEADTVVVAAGSRPNAALAEMLKSKVAEVHLAGDCVEARTIMDAIAEGNRVGRTV